MLKLIMNAAKIKTLVIETKCETGWSNRTTFKISIPSATNITLMDLSAPSLTCEKIPLILQYPLLLEQNINYLKLLPLSFTKYFTFFDFPLLVFSIILFVLFFVCSTLAAKLRRWKEKALSNFANERNAFWKTLINKESLLQASEHKRLREKREALATQLKLEQALTEAESEIKKLHSQIQRLWV